MNLLVRNLLDFPSDAASSYSMPHSRLFNGVGPSIRVGVIVEVAHRLTPAEPFQAYFPAVIVNIKGFFVQLAWITEQDDPSKYFWRNAGCSRAPRGVELDQRVHSIGYALKKQERYRVPDSVRSPLEDIADALYHELTGRETLPEDFQQILEQENACIFREGEILEIPDLHRPSCMRPVLALRASHGEVQVQYLDGAKELWFHELSEKLHPCGFARLRGLPLISTIEYRDECLVNLDGTATYPRNRYAPVAKFRPLFVPEINDRASPFTIGSKVEFLHPYERGIKVGTVLAVLGNNDLIIGPEEENGQISEKLVRLNGWSSQVLEPGFAATWRLEQYLHPLGYRHGEADLARGGFKRVIPKHDLEVGQFCEAVFEPGARAKALARVKRIVGHLVVIQFEKHPATHDRILPIGSEEMFPLGHCEAIGQALIH